MRRQAQTRKSSQGNSKISTPQTPMPVTACYSCRNARQKCDRQHPCSRCKVYGTACSYPSKSNRGRKPGRVNKPLGLKDLLSRISDPLLKENLIAAIEAEQSREGPHETGSIDPEPDAEPWTVPSNRDTSRQITNDILGDETISASPIENSSQLYLERPDSHSDNPRRGTYSEFHGHRVSGQSEHFPTVASDDLSETDLAESQCSPLLILAAAVGVERFPPGSTSKGWAGRPVPPPRFPEPLPQSSMPGQFQKNRAAMIADSKLAKYFAPRELDLRDWDVMTGIPPDSFCRLNPEVCDPVSAGLVNEQEVLQYFKLYFKIRHPSVGILDPDLHTAEYVHGCSFTLFSVICALGCELSLSHRDILLAPLLYNMAERNIKWSILNSVKTVEIIQAIIMFTFWSHAAQNYADDPSWLRFGHALSIARELKINDSSFIQKKVNNFNASNRNMYAGIRDRQVRNYERTWIFVFLMDKSFGITIGRAPCVSWREMQPELYAWARATSSAAGDLAITGIVQLRINLLQALERLFGMHKTLSSIADWDRSASSRLEELKGTSYSRQDGTQLESMFAAVFTFEVNHGLLLIRNNTYKHLVKLNAPQDKINNVLHEIFNISCEIIRLFVHDARLSSLASGYHNTPFVMISHAATEVIRSFKCPAISQEAQEQASTLIRNLAEHFGRIANKLPSTSWASLYLEYSLFLVRKLENIPCVAFRGSQGTLDHHTVQNYNTISISLDDEPQSSPNAWDFNGAAFFEMGNSLWQDNSASFLGVDSGQGSLFGGTGM